MEFKQKYGKKTGKLMNCSGIREELPNLFKICLYKDYYISFN